MCSPAILPMLSIASAVTGFIGANSAANTAQKQIQDGYAIQAEGFNAQREDIQDSAETDISDRVREAQVERGRLRVASGESGLSGSRRLANDVQFRAGTDISRIQKNAEKRTKQSKRSQAGARHQAKTNALQIKRPSLIGAGLQIGGAIDKYKNPV